jgi:hypothetical protein
MTTVVHCQLWEESERGWGTTRPDGSSLHRTDEDRRAFIDRYWGTMPDGTVPDCYSRPAGKAFPVDVDDETLSKITQSEDGIGIWVTDNRQWHPSHGVKVIK